MTASSQATAAPKPRRRFVVPPILAAMRPNQWTKNAVVLAAFVFAFWDREQTVVLADSLRVIPAMLLFCLVSSGVYVLNDIRDIASDRQHPLKRFRPIASGRLPLRVAWGLGPACLAAGLGGALLLSAPLAEVLGAYIVIQFLYTAGLKRIALVDIFVIAAGFVLRALAGAVVIAVRISPWLLLCAFLLALFLALCKRRQEKIQVADAHPGQRESLDDYHEGLLDQLIAVCAASTLVCYSIYTLWPGTVERFGTSELGFTIPFVAFGLFRYLDLAYRHSKGERPEKVLLTDLPLLATIALYGLTVVVILAWRA